MPPSGFSESMVRHLGEYLLECFEALRAEHPTDVHAGLTFERKQIERALAGDLSAVGGSVRATRGVLLLVDGFYAGLQVFPAEAFQGNKEVVNGLIYRAVEGTLAGVSAIHVTPEGKVVKKDAVTA